MKIDKVNIVRPATDMEKIIMETYGQKERYVFLTSDGNEYTVQFTQKSLSDFLPSQTVSGFMKSTQENFERRIAHLKQCIKDNVNIHGWTYQHKVLHSITNTPTGEVITKTVSMTKSMKEFAEKEIEKLKAISGKLQFVKIVYEV